MWKLGQLEGVGSWYPQECIPGIDLVIRLEGKHPHPLSHLASLSSISLRRRLAP